MTKTLKLSAFAALALAALAQATPAYAAPFNQKQRQRFVSMLAVNGTATTRGTQQQSGVSAFATSVKASPVFQGVANFAKAVNVVAKATGDPIYDQKAAAITSQYNSLVQFVQQVQQQQLDFLRTEFRSRQINRRDYRFFRQYVNNNAAYLIARLGIDLQFTLAVLAQNPATGPSTLIRI